MDMTQDWSVAEWQLDPPFAEAVRHVHSPLCGDHPRVVVGVGNSDESVAALQWAGWEAQLRGTHLHVVNAWEPHGSQARVQRKQRQRQARRLMRQALDRAFPHLPGHVEPVTVHSRPAEVLVAASHGAALLVVGSHERGPFGRMLTSMAGRGAAFRGCPVAVVQDGRHDHPRPGKVVVGIDGSFTSWDALRWAATEARYRDAELKVVDVAFLRPGMLPGNLPHDEGQMLARMLGEVLVGPLAGVTASVDPEPAYRYTFGDRGKGISPWAWSWPGRRRTRTCSWWGRMATGTAVVWRLAQSQMTAWLRQRARSSSSRHAARMSPTVPGMPSPPRSGDLLWAAWPAACSGHDRPGRSRGA